METIIELIKTKSLGKIKENEELSKHSYIQTGGKVSLLFYPETVEGLIEVIDACKNNDILYKVVGRGSNIIFPDKNLNIVIIKISDVFDEIDFLEDGYVLVGSGLSLQKFSRQTAKLGLSGLEFAGGIPGSIGGATYMNAGAHTHEMSDIIAEVTYLDENNVVQTIKKEDCLFDYRSSIFHNNAWIILKVLFKFKESSKDKTIKRMSGNLAYRKEMQPLDKPSFGSVFRNPPGGHAGKIIEDLGLKGSEIGDAKISDKHANFIINTGKAKSKDIKELINYIKDEVKDKKSIQLKTEVELFLDGIDE